MRNVDLAVGNGRIRPIAVVRPLAINTAQYVYRCLLSLRHLPGIARLFVLDLYQQTILGWWWVIVQALLPTLGIIAIFQHIEAFQSAKLPYSLHVFSGMLLWVLIGNGLARGTRALRRTRALQARIAIPRLTFVIASAVLPAIYFSIFGIVLAATLVGQYFYSGVFFLKIGWQLLLVPFPILICFLIYVGISSVASVVFLFARDVRFSISLITQLWFYLTPIMYTMDVLPNSWQTALLYCNPMATLIELFRWLLFGVGIWTFGSLAAALSLSLAIFLLGAWVLMRSEWALPEMLRS
jgi:lipopolysaccharide transport system permease protein